jgi:hypothetical protein
MTYIALPVKLKTVVPKPHSCKESTYDSAFFLFVLRLNDPGQRKEFSNLEIRGKPKCRKRERKKKGRINKKFCHSDIVTVRWLLMSVDGNVSGPTDIKRN